MEVIEDRDGEIEAYQGSQLRTRLLGGWWINARHFPETVWITLTPIEEGVRVKTTTEESMGFGLMDSIMIGKYETFFEEWLVELRRAVQ